MKTNITSRDGWALYYYSIASTPAASTTRAGLACCPHSGELAGTGDQGRDALALGDLRLQTDSPPSHNTSIIFGVPGRAATGCCLFQTQRFRQSGQSAILYLLVILASLGAAGVKRLLAIMPQFSWTSPRVDVVRVPCAVGSLGRAADLGLVQGDLPAHHCPSNSAT